MELFKILGKISIDSSQAEQSLGDTTEKAQQTQQKLSGILGKIGAAVGAAFTAQKVIEFGTACVKSAANAETSFAKVNTLLADGTNTTAYFDSIKNGSVETGVAITDFSEAVYSAISASVDQAHAVEFTTQAIKLAKGGFTDAATSVDVLTTAINAYGLNASDATSISDKLVVTQNLGKTTVGELAAVMGRSIPTARAYNVGLDTLCGTYAILTKNGNPAAESTTLLNAMLNELGKSGTIAATALRDETGKSFAELMESGYSLSDVLEIVQSVATRSGVAINDMFGSAEAGKAANVLINNTNDLNNSIAAMADSAGATEKAYAKMENTVSAKIDKLKNRFEVAKTEIGEAFLPVLSVVVDNFDDIAIAAGTLVTAIGAKLAGQAVMKLIAAFQMAQVQLSLYTATSEGATIAQGVLTGALTLGEIATGVLTGQVSLATAAQYAWNTAMNANPIGLVIGLLGGLVIAYRKVSEASQQQIAEIAGTAESYDEAAAKAAELRHKIEDLENAPGGWTYARTQEIHGYKMALQEVEEQMGSFQEAEQVAAEAAADPVNRFQEATDTYTSKATELMNKFQETYSNIYKAVSGWFEPFAQAAVSVETSVDKIISNMQSQVDFNNQYTENLAYLKEAGLGSLSEALQSYGKEGAAYAQTICDSLAKVGGASTDEGQKIVKSLQDGYENVKQSQSSLSEAMTDLSGEFASEMDRMTTEYAAKIQELDKSDEALESAKSTINGLIAGITGGSGEVINTLQNLGSQMTSALQSQLGTVYINVETRGSGVKSSKVPLAIDGSHADGLNYVPFDGYIAQLHRGEMVVPANQAQGLRDGTADGSTQIIALLSAILDSLGDNIKQQVANTNIQLNGRELGRVVRGLV